MTYVFALRQPGNDQWLTLHRFSDWTVGWDIALNHFDVFGLKITGCHLDHDAHHAMFTVTDGNAVYGIYRLTEAR